MLGGVQDKEIHRVLEVWKRCVRFPHREHAASSQGNNLQRSRDLVHIEFGRPLQPLQQANPKGLRSNACVRITGNEAPTAVNIYDVLQVTFIDPVGNRGSLEMQLARSECLQYVKARPAETDDADTFRIHQTVRRQLFDSGFIARDLAGSFFWSTPDRTIADL